MPVFGLLCVYMTLININTGNPGVSSRVPRIPDDFWENFNPVIYSNFPGIPGIFIFLKYKVVGVTDGLFG